MSWNRVDLSSLIGLTFTTVSEASGMGYSDEEGIKFVSQDGRTFGLYHNQDCCESVYVEDIAGDLTDLVGTPILVADERSEDDPKLGEFNVGGWTFYEFRTLKGSVTIRFYGSSNGYYGTSADLYEQKDT